MLVKKLGMLLVLVMVLVTLAAPGARMRASAQTCSGDDCGCGVAFTYCRLNCAGNLTCISQCRRENVQCSIACCSW